MARPTVVDLGELARLKASMSVEALAKHFHCSERSIIRSVKKLQDQTPRAVLVNNAQMERAVTHNLNAMDEWYRIHDEIDQILADVKKANDTDGRLQVVARYQKSFDQLLKLSELFHDWRAVQTFQQEVLKVIQEVSPDARAEIERRLESRRALFLSLERPAG